MKIAFDVDMADVEAFEVHHIETRNKKATTICIIGALLPSIMLAVLVFRRGDAIFDGPIIFWLGMLAWIVYMKFYAKDLALRQKKKELSNPNEIQQLMYADMCGFREMIFEDEGIKTHRTAEIEILKWSKIKSLEETSKYFFLYVSKTAAVIISKEKIKTNEIEELNMLFKKNFQGRINTF